MSLRDKYTDEEFEALELEASQRDFSPGWTQRVEENSRTVQVPEGSLILTPNMAIKEIEEELEKRVLRQNYEKLLSSGMFWEFYPELSGEWKKDREVWEKIAANKN